MSDGSPAEKGVIRPPNPADAITLDYVPRRIPIYHLTETEISTLTQGGETPAMTLCGICVGVCFASLIVIVTVPTDYKAFAGFVGAAIVTGLLAVFFGLQASRTRKAAGREQTRIIREHRHGV